jgi:hypothetical protein
VYSQDRANSCPLNRRVCQLGLSVDITMRAYPLIRARAFDIPDEWLAKPEVIVGRAYPAPFVRGVCAKHSADYTPAANFTG